MAFTAITSAQIGVGEPTAKELFQKVKDNFDDHESRLSAAETATNIFQPYSFEVLGTTGQSLVMDGLMHVRVPFNITLLGARLLILTAGSAGTTTIDLEYKRGVAAFASILSAPISATSASGSFYLASGSLAVSSLLAGDIVRLNVDAVQTQGKDFIVLLEYEKS